MKHVDPKQTEFAFVFPETPMILHLITELDAEETLPATRKRDMVSGLRRVSNGLNRAPDEVPADPTWLQPRIAKVTPAALGLSPKSWQNAVSDARSAMAHFGIVKRRHRHIDDLSPAWRTLWERVLASKDKTLSLALPRFVHYLNRVGVAPQEVTQAHADSFLEAIIANEISKSPEVGWINAINAWNLAVTRIENWPQITLEKPRRQKVYKRADADLPAGFIADLTTLMQRMAQPDPFAEGEPTRPLRPHTITAYTRQLKRFASELLEAGVPPEEITSVAALCEPKRAEIGLRAMFERNGNQKNKLIAETAALLRNLVSKLDLGDDVRKQLAQLAGRVSMPKQKGMMFVDGVYRVVTAAAPDLDWSRHKRLLGALKRLAKGGTPERKRGRILSSRVLLKAGLDLAGPQAQATQNALQRALKQRDGTMVALLALMPIRLRALHELSLGTSVYVEEESITVALSEDMTKTGVPWEADISEPAATVFRTYLTETRPFLMARGKQMHDRLWVEKKGAPMQKSTLRLRIAETTLKQTGIRIPPHFFRHAAATTLARENTTASKLIRPVLAHSGFETAEKHYIQATTLDAGRAFNALLQKKKNAGKVARNTYAGGR